MKLIITENQEQIILNNLLQEEVDYSEKRLLVKKYLDDNFKKGELNKKGEESKPVECYVQVTKEQQPIKTFDDKRLFYHIQAKFRDILPEEERDEFLQDVINKWRDKKISSAGSSLS